MEFSKEIESKIEGLIEAWAIEYLDGKPIVYAYALNGGIKRELEKVTEAIKEK